MLANDKKLTYCLVSRISHSKSVKCWSFCCKVWWCQTSSRSSDSCLDIRFLSSDNLGFFGILWESLWLCLAMSGYVWLCLAMCPVCTFGLPEPEPNWDTAQRDTKSTTKDDWGWHILQFFDLQNTLLYTLWHRKATVMNSRSLHASTRAIDTFNKAFLLAVQACTPVGKFPSHGLAPVGEIQWNPQR